MFHRTIKLLPNTFQQQRICNITINKDNAELHAPILYLLVILIEGVGCLTIESRPCDPTAVANKLLYYIL